MGNQSESAGKFPFVVDLHRPTYGNADTYGHKPATYKLAGQAAARVWTASNAGTSSDPADLVTHAPRLLLKEPLAGIEINWRVTWKGKLFTVDATEERGFDLLVTLSPVARASQ